MPHTLPWGCHVLWKRDKENSGILPCLPIPTPNRDESFCLWSERRGGDMRHSLKRHSLTRYVIVSWISSPLRCPSAWQWHSSHDLLEGGMPGARDFIHSVLNVNLFAWGGPHSPPSPSWDKAGLFFPLLDATLCSGGNRLGCPLCRCLLGMVYNKYWGPGDCSPGTLSPIGKEMLPQCSWKQEPQLEQARGLATAIHCWVLRTNGGAA